MEPALALIHLFCFQCFGHDEAHCRRLKSQAIVTLEGKWHFLQLQENDLSKAGRHLGPRAPGIRCALSKPCLKEAFLYFSSHHILLFYLQVKAGRVNKKEGSVRDSRHLYCAVFVGVVAVESSAAAFLTSTH